MKKTIKLIGILALVALIGFSLIACGKGNSNSVTYKGTNDGTTYTLKITKAAAESVTSPTGTTNLFAGAWNGAAIGTVAVARNTLAVTGKSLDYTPTLVKSEESLEPVTPAAGDAYELKVGKKKSTGTVEAVAGGKLILKPKTADAGTFNATVGDNGLINVTGLITFDDKTTEEGPGELTPTAPPISDKNDKSGGGGLLGGGSGGKLTLNNIPAKYNGKYVVVFLIEETKAPICGFEDADQSDKSVVLAKISGGKATLPLWGPKDGSTGKIDKATDYAPFRGSGSYSTSMVAIMNQGRLKESDFPRDLENMNPQDPKFMSTIMKMMEMYAAVVFFQNKVNVSNGNAALSCNDGQLMDLEGLFGGFQGF